MLVTLKKICTFVTGITAFLIVSQIYFGLQAMAADQQAILDIEPRNDIVLFVPEDFSFPQAFAPQNNDMSYVYTILTPDTNEQKLRVLDSDDTHGFTVTVSATPLISNSNGTDIINVDNLGMVTLSTNTIGAVDGVIGNVPEGAPNVTAPLYCVLDTQNPTATLANTCNATMVDFSPLISASSSLASPLGINDSLIFLADANGFEPSGNVVIGNNLIAYNSITSNVLGGASGINQSYDAGTAVTQQALMSTPLTLLQDSVATDTGMYSIGFGFRLKLEDAVKKGLFNGNLTFDLILL